MADFANGGVIPTPDLSDGQIPAWLGVGCDYVIPKSHASRHSDPLRRLNESPDTGEDTER